MTATVAQKALRRQGNKSRAKATAGFFKTGRGQYGFGDKFLGVTMPNTRQVAREFADLPLSEIKNLLHSAWHEDRMLGLVILTSQFKKAGLDKRQKIVDFYLANLSRVNNWDLVDVSAGCILGESLVGSKNRSILYELIKSKNLWSRRVAVVATSALIRQGDFSDIIKLAKISLTDKEDLMHKAVGWMLREAGKKDSKILITFLNEFAGRMPRVMLRYALEKLTPNQRRHYRSIPRVL